MKLCHYILLALLLLPATSCELYKQDGYQEYYVVESYLIADRELPQVRVTKTLPVEEQYTFEQAALDDASVEIRLLNPEGTIEETFKYRMRSAGVYGPLNNHTVISDRVYELYVSFPDGEVVRSTTLVPGNFETVESPASEYVYQSPEQIRVTVGPSFYPDRQTFYIFTVNAGDPQEENLTPFYRDLVDNQDGNISNFYVNSSGIINEGNYESDENGNITLDVPWLAIAFFGPNDIVANAIDDNMYDFLRSQDVQTGGSTLSPGEIQNVNYNIEGGIGIFGSMASDTNRVTIIPE